MYIVNVAPQPVLLGVQDLSGRTLPVVAEAIPQHFPIVPMYTRKGDPDIPAPVVGISAEQTYGAESFDYRGPYATHSTVLYREALAPHANLSFIKRIIAPGAKKATARLSIEVVRSENPVYQTDQDGYYLLDQDGNKQIDPNYQITGHRIRWVLNAIPETGVGKFGDAQLRVGTLRPHPSQGSESVNSTIYAVADLEVEIGARGNDVGFKLWAATANDDSPTDVDIIDELNSMMYRLQLVERANSKSSPKTVLDADGSRYVDFSFNEVAYSDLVKRSVALRDVYANYTTKAREGQARKEAPFKRIAIYNENIDEVLSMLNALENESSNGEDLPDSMFNFISGTSPEGVPYRSIELLGPLDGGIRLDSDTVHYAVGGSDGDMTPENFEQGVREWLGDWENDKAHYLDDAYWPISFLWDSGYDMETKELLSRPMGLRKDIGCALATQSASRPLNDGPTDSSLGIALRNQLLLTPESVYYGTSNCRGSVWEGSFYLEDSEWTKPVPLTIDLAKKVARYMGASNGRYKVGQNFDRAPKSVVELTTRERFNAPYRPQAIRNKDWRNGLGFAQSYSRNSVFYPAFPSAYPDKTSILSNFRVSLAVGEIEKVCQRTWRAMTNSSDSPEDFIAESNSVILANCKDRFDGLYTIKPETYFDSFDEASGYSWKCRVNLYAGTSRIIGVFTIAARRAEDLL